jgi:tRNA pseudouridine55 synthase
VGETLGCGGCMSALRRTRSGCFGLETALAIGSLREEGNPERLAVHLLPLADALPGLAEIDVDEALAERLRNGYQPDGESLSRYHIPFLAAGDVVKFILRDRHLVAVARMSCASDELASEEGKKQAVRILRVFDD